MLQILKNKNKTEAQRLLSIAAKSLLPSPGVSEAEVISEEIKSSLLAIFGEVRKKLKLATDDNSYEARTKILKFLSDEMKNLVFNEVNFKQAKDRIGLKGDLSPKQYSIKFGDISKELNSRGIRNSHVEDVLHNPDYVEHLLRGVAVDLKDTPISIYAKENLGNKKQDKFILVVEAKREGSTLQVSQAWRVYYSDVKLFQPLSPVGILKSFVEKYGISFQIGDALPTKFCLYETISAPLSVQPKDIIKINSERAQSFVANFLIKQSSLGPIEVGLAYVIDTLKYKQDLLKHNVSIELKGLTQGST